MFTPNFIFNKDMKILSRETKISLLLQDFLLETIDSDFSHTQIPPLRKRLLNANKYKFWVTVHNENIGYNISAWRNSNQRKEIAAY